MQLVGIVLLYSAGLNGSEDIESNKYALTLFRMRQRGEMCQMM